MPATSATGKSTLFLVVDSVGDVRVFVFMDQDPTVRGGPQAENVTLDLLPGGRFCSTVELGARPVLGQDPNIPERFREFRNEIELERARFKHIPHYRICDSWEDYHNPWLAPPSNGDSTGLGTDSLK